MQNNHPPTATSHLWAAIIAPVHAISVNFSSDSGGVGLTLSIILLIVGLLIVLGTFIWQIKIDKDKRKW